MKIVSVPSPVLFSKAKTILSFDKKIQKLIEEMEITLEAQVDPEGVGLAAPQVGEPLRLFIIKPTKKSTITAYINPEVIERGAQNVEPVKKKGKKEGTKLEGCLSIPRIWGKVERVPRILLRFQTIANETREQWFEGFEAVIIQHEMDHLEGILFTRRVLEQGNQLYKEEEGELVKYEI